MFDTPGHTRGHICLWMPQAEALFCGEAAMVRRTRLRESLRGGRGGGLGGRTPAQVCQLVCRWTGSTCM